MFFWLHHTILPNICLLKQAVKNVDQSQHTSDQGSALLTLSNFAKDSECSERSHNKVQKTGHFTHLEQTSQLTQKLLCEGLPSQSH